MACDQGEESRLSAASSDLSVKAAFEAPGQPRQSRLEAVWADWCTNRLYRPISVFLLFALCALWLNAPLGPAFTDKAAVPWTGQEQKGAGLAAVSGRLADAYGLGPTIQVTAIRTPQVPGFHSAAGLEDLLAFEGEVRSLSGLSVETSRFPSLSPSLISSDGHRAQLLLRAEEGATLAGVAQGVAWLAANSESASLHFEIAGEAVSSLDNQAKRDRAFLLGSAIGLVGLLTLLLPLWRTLAPVLLAGSVALVSFAFAKGVLGGSLVGSTAMSELAALVVGLGVASLPPLLAIGWLQRITGAAGREGKTREALAGHPSIRRLSLGLALRFGLLLIPVLGLLAIVPGQGRASLGGLPLLAGILSSVLTLSVLIPLCSRLALKRPYLPEIPGTTSLAEQWEQLGEWVAQRFSGARRGLGIAAVALLLLAGIGFALGTTKESAALKTAAAEARAEITELPLLLRSTSSAPLPKPAIVALSEALDGLPGVARAEALWPSPFVQELGLTEIALVMRFEEPATGTQAVLTFVERLNGEPDALFALMPAGPGLERLILADQLTQHQTALVLLPLLLGLAAWLFVGPTGGPAALFLLLSTLGLAAQKSALWLATQGLGLPLGLDALLVSASLPTLLAVLSTAMVLAVVYRFTFVLTALLALGVAFGAGLLVAPLPGMVALGSGLIGALMLMTCLAACFGEMVMVWGAQPTRPAEGARAVDPAVGEHSPGPWVRAAGYGVVALALVSILFLPGEPALSVDLLK